MSIYFTPGPSELHPATLGFLNKAIEEKIPSISHRSKQFEEIYKKAGDMLRSLLKAPSDWQVFFLGSATEAMERIVQNCSRRKTFHLVNGAFSKNFFEIAKDYKRQAVEHRAEAAQGFNLDQISVAADVELVCLTQSETSTGIWTPPDHIKILKAKAPQALLAIDIVSSAPCVDLNFADFDLAFLSVQKCFGLPAGLGVLLASPASLQRAQEIEASGACVGSYHSFGSLLSDAKRHQTPETPNVLGIFLLGEICAYFVKYGRERIIEETRTKAKLIYDFLNSHSSLKPAVKSPCHQALTVAAVSVPSGSASLIQKLKERGYIVGSGYAELKDSQIRIANFPAHSTEQVKALLTEMA